ncbi:2-carboxy-1,4-naphthoquinone phytyltransferase, chloroplastic isoform X2 [Malania oleifera]|uniref:2-carboxy-1,4-naphthoquinone phytyltransferase, chloroplastic isoform X2 n=1 Tax=Malania oleifera TaxID=397392 RepID=UPI0025AE3F83|nr:2-carboxy-1,4-naphthoquinone phytyltransferase, chloroplastic isoform X2 [Malania oleifera]
MEARVCILSLGFSPKKYLLNQSNGQCAQRFCNRACRRQLKNKRHHPCWKSSIESCERSNTSHEEIKEKNISRATLIWRAIKLPIYSVALVPLSVGSAAAYLQTGIFSARRYSVLLASSVLIITWLNLSNDVYDYDTGADKNKKESVVNMVGSRTTTLAAAYVLLVLGSFGLAWVSMEAGSIHSLLLLASAITCGYMYQCPPFRLSYQGLGEPLCFAAFGPFATTAFYLLQSSLGYGFWLPATMDLDSNLIEGDRDVGKMSPLVRLGTEAGSRVVSVAIITLYSLLVLLTLSKALPLTCIFCCGLTLPIGKLVAKYVEENHKNKTKIFMAKYYCVRLHALFGSTLVAGLVIARMISNRQLPHLMFP